MSLKLGTTTIAGVPTNMINTVNELNNLYSDLNNRLNSRVYLKKSDVKGTSGYNIWSNGYCEQWGCSGPIGPIDYVITFIKRYKDTNYNIMTCEETLTHNPNNGDVIVNIKAKSATSMTLRSGNTSQTIYWKTCGYLPEGEY